MSDQPTICTLQGSPLGTSYNATTDIATSTWDIACENGIVLQACVGVVLATSYQLVSGTYIPIGADCSAFSLGCGESNDNYQVAATKIGTNNGPGQYKIIWQLWSGTCSAKVFQLSTQTQFFTVT